MQKLSQKRTNAHKQPSCPRPLFQQCCLAISAMIRFSSLRVALHTVRSQIRPELVLTSEACTERNARRACYTVLRSATAHCRFELNYSYARELNFMDEWTLKVDPSCRGPAACQATVAPVINSTLVQHYPSLRPPSLRAQRPPCTHLFQVEHA